jgi:hypothetical protein
VLVIEHELSDENGCSFDVAVRDGAALFAYFVRDIVWSFDAPDKRNNPAESREH